MASRVKVTPATGDSKPDNAPGIGNPVVAPMTAVEILTAKRAIYADHAGLFVNELAAVDAAINAEVFAGTVGEELDKLDITAITGSRTDGVWTFSRMRRVSASTTTDTDKADNPTTTKVDRRARLHNGTIYRSAKALCVALGHPTNGDSAVRVLAKHSIAWYDLPVKVTA